MRIFDWFIQRVTDPSAPIKKLSVRVVQKKEGLQPLIDFVETLPIMRDVLDHHEKNVTDFQHWYSALCLHGAGQWVNGVYVPVAALANPITVDFICTIMERKDGWDAYNKWLYISDRLVNFIANKHDKPLEASYLTGCDV
jgi:hypothetical protein